MLKFFIGIGIPFIAVAGLLPFVNSVQWTFMNVPFAYLWIFLWFILTTVCLFICWFCFDRHSTETH
ncbi:DUF3311 domain-containing protein [Acidocella sp.]|uniref:DUF3311 domain-containing protein n=1 Tax=Acidocella sp. TaxID=50710 RepID=UPI003D02AA6D